MSEPLVSVVTPSYEQRGFIEDTLDSVASQDHTAIEHVVVDGGSDDGTVPLLEEYGDEHDHLRWISEPDDGQADAINKGFDMAEGDVVGWLNSDDVYFDTGVLSRVVDHLDRTGADVVYGDIALLDADSTVLKLHLTPRFDLDKLRRYCFIEQPAVFIDAQALDGVRLDESLDYVMDYELWLRLAIEHDLTFRHVADVLAGDRNHPDRKILRDRQAMRAESRSVGRRYGAADGASRRLARLGNVALSGLPRRLLAVRRTLGLHADPPDFAFDGRLAPRNRMLVNALRQSRHLV